MCKLSILLPVSEEQSHKRSTHSQFGAKDLDKAGLILSSSYSKQVSKKLVFVTRKNNCVFEVEQQVVLTLLSIITCFVD